eukprot:31482-Eustigmatos_ZCMA.PRE.1
MVARADVGVGTVPDDQQDTQVGDLVGFTVDHVPVCSGLRLCVVGPGDINEYLGGVESSSMSSILLLEDGQGIVYC